jgi:hypothetical protein
MGQSTFHPQLKNRIATTALVACLVAIAIMKFSITAGFSQTQGRFSVPPIPDDISYLSQATKDANALREKGWSLGALQQVLQHRHSPILSTFATSSYLISPPRYVLGSGDWSSFYLPNKVAGFSMLLLIPFLFWCLFGGQAYGLPVLAGTLSIYSFSWTGGLITEFRPDLISGLLLGSGVLLLCQRAFHEKVPLIVAPVLVLGALYAKPTTFLPIFLTASTTILLVYLCCRRWGLGTARLYRRNLIGPIFCGLLLLIPFLVLNLGPTASYVYQAVISDSRIWSGAFQNQSLTERLLWYLQPLEGGGISMPLTNQTLLLAVLGLLILRLAVGRRLGNKNQLGHYKGFTLALLCGLPYYLMASLSSHKGHFIGAFIGIFLSLLLAGIIATLVLELVTSSRRSTLLLALPLVAYLGAIAIATPPFEAFWWPYGYSLQDRKAAQLHRDLVDQSLASLSSSPTLSHPESRVFVAATRFLHGTLVDAYLQSQKPPAKGISVANGEQITGDRALIRAIDSSDVVIFESKELADSFYHFDLYKPAVQNHLQQLAKGIKAVQVHETNARVRLKDGRDQGVVVISQQRHSAALAP